MNSFSSIQRTASRLLGAALSECLPGLEIQDLGEALGGIYCNFYFAGPISSELLAQVEQTLRRLIQENHEIKLLEMVPFSAAEFLKKKGQKERAEQVLQQEGLVQIVQIGPFIDWAEGDHLSYPREIGLVRLLEFKSLKKGLYRVFGISAPNKEELKQRLALREVFARNNHEVIGTKRQFWVFSDKKRVWLPRGLALRQVWFDFWREHLRSFVLETEGDLTAVEKISREKGFDGFMQFSRLEDHEAGERGLVDAPDWTLLLKFFDSPANRLISFLQTIGNAITILGFNYRILRFGKKRRDDPVELAALQKPIEWCSGDSGIEFLVEDSLGCEWPVLSVSEDSRQKRFCAVLEVERNLALLLEKSGESLPFWLQPEHLRVLFTEESFEDAAKREVAFFKKHGFRALCDSPRGKESLADCLRRSQNEGIPFVAIIGDSELKDGLISWRKLGDVRKETAHRNRLLALLCEAAGDRD